MRSGWIDIECSLRIVKLEIDVSQIRLFLKTVIFIYFTNSIFNKMNQNIKVLNKIKRNKVSELF